MLTPAERQALKVGFIVIAIVMIAMIAATIFFDL